MFKGVEPLALVDGGRRVVFMSDEYQVATYSLATGTLECWSSALPRDDGDQTRTELRQRVNGELTLPVIPAQELDAQSTHQFTLNLTEPIAGRIRSRTRRI